MATALSTPTVSEISVEEYIDHFVEGNEKPTCEYVDGQLLQKSMGTTFVKSMKTASTPSRN